MADTIKISIEGKKVSIKNKTSEFLNNCFIEVKTIYNRPLLLRIFDLNPKETIELYLNNYDIFSDSWRDQKLYVKLYHDHTLIYSKHFFDKTKCYVLLSNKPFEKLTEQLIIGLTRYSNVDIYHYTIGYKSTLEYDYLTNIEFDLEGDINDPQYMQFAKPPIFLDIINRGFENAVFIDSDIQVKSNIDDIFSYIPEIEDGPLLHASPWDFVVAHGNYIPGPLLSEAVKLDTHGKGQRAPHGITNIVLFNKKHKSLFKKWKQICFSDKINEIRKEEFMHDELIFNSLLWKEEVAPKLFFLALNVLGEDDVQFFYEHTNNDYNDHVNMNDFGKGHFAQSFIPYNRHTVLCFHCVKDVDEAKKINDYIYKKEIIMKQNGNFSIYSNIKQNKDIIKKVPPLININFIDGPFIEIKNSSYTKHKVSFINKDTYRVEYSNEIGNNCWVKTNKKHFVNWQIKIEDENKNLIYNYDLDFKDQKVYIALDSKSLGDTLAWFPYVEEFRKKHNCEVIVSTFHNYLFKPYYPHLKFINPGETAHGIKAMYTVGWYYNEDNTVNYDRNPRDFKDQSLQKTASDILGLEFKEVHPIIANKNPKKKKQIAIAMHSTTQAKYWNNPTGWQEVVDWCKEKGYEVKLVSREGDGYMGNHYPKGITKHPEGSLEVLMDELLQSEAFIGIGSGLSWLSWALEIPTVLISGFSKDYTEPSICYRITAPEGKCNGCFNTHRLDPGDWNWCPVHKGTDRQFECSKSITSEIIIEKLKKILAVS
jgi:autotransporter strand-loop-strand O-heptosyltransferase